jgi:DNA-binding MarR family transcriptional regulator
MSHSSRPLHRHEIRRSNSSRLGPARRTPGDISATGDGREWRRRVATGTLRVEPALVALLHVGAAWGVRLDAALREVGLAPSEYCVLRSLVNAGESLSPDSLADRGAGEASDIMEVVHKLEEDNLVDGVDDPGNASAIRVRVTPLGRRRQAAGARKVDAVSRQFEAAMPAPDQAALQRIVSRLA